jgi:small subunit ribosomal protein S6
MARDPNYRKYETVFILRTDLSDEDKGKALAKVDSILKDFDGHAIRREDWGPRKLAYKIEKQTKGFYFYQLFLGKGGLVLELERNFRLMDSVLKFMTVTIDDNIVLADFDFAGEAKELTWMAEQRGAKAAAAAEAEERQAAEEASAEADAKEEAEPAKAEDAPEAAEAPEAVEAPEAEAEVAVEEKEEAEGGEEVAAEEEEVA